MNTFAIGSLPVHFSVAKLFTFRWQYTSSPYVNQLSNGKYVIIKTKEIKTKIHAEQILDYLKK